MDDDSFKISVRELKRSDMIKIDQIIHSGLLDVKGDVAEIHFDKDGNIRKIRVPKITTYP